MRVAQVGEVWEWCVTGDEHVPDHLRWEPVLLLEKIGPAKHRPSGDGLYDWIAYDLLTGELCEVFNVPQIGWEKVE